MTSTIVSPAHVSARSFLFPGADGVGELQRAMNAQGVARMVGVALGAASRGGCDAAALQMAAVVGGLLDLDLDDLLLQGWKTHTALVDAARRTVAAPGSREVVELAAHRVTSQREFHVDVMLERVHVARVHRKLTAEFVVAPLVGVVVDGRLLEVRGGESALTVTLSAEGKQLCQKAGALPLPGRMRLGSGMELLTPERRDAVPVQPRG